MHSDDLSIHSAALSYLIIMLIQRMDKMQSGFSRELIEGIKADKQASNPVSEQIAAIFDKAIQIVEQASVSSVDDV